MSKTVYYISHRSTSRPISDQLALAKKAGFAIDQIVVEEISVPNFRLPLDKQETGKRLFDLLGCGDVLICHWIDSFGSNFREIRQNICLCLDKGITVKTLNGGVIFDANPKNEKGEHIRYALLSFMSALAKAQSLKRKEAQAAGIAYAKAKNKLAYKGRKPTYTKK